MTISSKVKFLFYNILGESTVSITAYDSGYPASRLYDHSLGFYCRYSTAGAFVVQVNQSAAPLPVDTLVIENHNLNGIAVTWDYSANGSSWTTAQSWTQSGTGQILKSLTSPVTANYWRVSMGSHAFQATEIFMGAALAVPVVWNNTPGFTDVPDVESFRTYGGVDHFLRIGPKRKQRNYTLFMDRVNYPVATFVTYVDYLDDYSKPFYVIDHEVSCFLSTFGNNPPNFNHINEGLMEFDVTVMETK